MSKATPEADGLVTRSIRVSRKDWDKWKQAAEKAGVRTVSLVTAAANAAAKAILGGKG
jgi:hypothetical protein